jgi:predicted dehydrogenase
MSSEKQPGAALIGCGAVAELLYTQALRELETEGTAKVVALVDPNPQRSAKIAAAFPESRQYCALNDLLAETSPDLAIIATPHRFHTEMALTCFQKGCHVLCEKPMALTTSECDQMIDAAEKAGRVLAIGHFRRFYPSCKMIKQILDTAILGPVRSFHFIEGETYSWPAQSASFFKRKEAGGGVLIDAGVHLLDLLLWWLGDVADVHYQDDAMGGVEANCRMTLRMISGAQGMVHLSRDWPPPNNRYVIECERGWIAYTYDVVDQLECGLHDSDCGLQAVIHSARASGRQGTHLLGPAVDQAMTTYFTAQLRNVIGAISGTEPLQVSGKDARKAIALIEKCYQCRELLEMPWHEEVELGRGRELADV